MNMIEFLTKLKNNNRKGWIDENRNEYDTAKKEFELLIGESIEAISIFDNSVKSVEPKSCIFRINRDVRFSKNKNPYKSNFAAYIHANGKKADDAGYYLHMEPEASFLAAGIWMPESELCSAIRQEIDYQSEEWNSLIKKPDFKKHFPDGFDQSMKLVRAPKGYEENNPAIEYLKLKSFIVRKNISDTFWSDKKRTTNISTAFKAAKPLVDFLNRAKE